MNKNEFTTKGAKVTMNGEVGVVMKALPYKTVINFEGQDRWVHLRHNQNDMSQLKPFLGTEIKQTETNKSSYSEAVRKAVKVLNAPMGLVSQKQSFITQKLMSQGYTNQEATTVFLEALNIASNGELLQSV
jgi:hypothetical protein